MDASATGSSQFRQAQTHGASQQALDKAVMLWGLNKKQPAEDVSNSSRLTQKEKEKKDKKVKRKKREKGKKDKKGKSEKG